jgi:hypothetical protein
MVAQKHLKPVEDSVAKVNDEIAVGEDLTFQRRWWRFENAAWMLFGLLILMDLAGLFGRGPLSKAERQAPDGSLNVKYERIQRTESSSIMTIQFAQSAIKNGNIHLFVSDSVVAQLGTQRVIPAPQETTVGEGGLTYSFLASKPPATVALDMEPTGPGIYDFTVGVSGGTPVKARVVVVP